MPHLISFSFFFNDTATTQIYTLSLHDALPISHRAPWYAGRPVPRRGRTAIPGPLACSGRRGTSGTPTRSRARGQPGSCQSPLGLRVERRVGERRHVARAAGRVDAELPADHVAAELGHPAEGRRLPSRDRHESLDAVTGVIDRLERPR